jgi:hypothetical protein
MLIKQGADHRTGRKRKARAGRPGGPFATCRYIRGQGTFAICREPGLQDPNPRLIDPTMGDRLIFQHGGFSVALPPRSQRGPPNLAAGAAIVRRMALPDLDLAGRFVAVVYDLTSGQPGRFRRIDDCAKRAGIKRLADLTQAVATAEAAGFLVVHVGEQLVMLTSKGREVARG